MKKITAFIASVLLLMCFSACGLFYAYEPELASTLRIPSPSEITGVSIGSTLVVRTDEETKAKAIAFLQSAIPTKLQSVNDSPTEAPCYVFLLQSTESDAYLYHGFFYEREYHFGLSSKWYYEIPYYGIYEIPEKYALALIEE